MTTTATVLLLVFAEPGPTVSEEEYYKSYADGYMPVTLANSATLLSSIRWKAIDGEHPTYAATYNLESYDATHISSSNTSTETRSEVGEEMSHKLQLLDWRLYTQIGHPSHPPSSLYDTTSPAPYAVFVSLELAPEFEGEFNRWNDEEHIPMLAKAPGWVRSRRFVLMTSGRTGAGEHNPQKKPPKYLAIHEWKTMDGFQSAEYKAAMSTSWRQRVMQGVASRERRVVTLLRMDNTQDGASAEKWECV